MQTTETLRADARRYSAQAAQATRAAERDAKKAADAYATSRRWARQAAELTQAPRLWTGDYTPANLEANARTWTSLGDIYLRSSFRATADSAFNRELAASYRELAARSAARMAELSA